MAKSENAQKQEIRVNDLWIGDHWALPLFVRKGEGAARPWMSVLVDAQSRCVVGWSIAFQPDATEIFRLLADTVKGGGVFQGVPERVYLDEGKDYKAQPIEGDEETARDMSSINHALKIFKKLSEGMGILCHHTGYRAQARLLRMRGVMERAWLRELPGYCGADTPKTMEQIRQEPLLTLEELKKLYEDSILPNYHNRKDGEESPMEVYRRGVKGG